MIEPAPRQAATAGYRERLRTPWWWYLIGVVVGILLGAEFDFVMPQSLVGIPVLISIALALAVVWRLSSSTVEVRDGQVLAGTRSVPVAGIEQLYPLGYHELRRLVGRHSDPLAFTFVRSWVGPGVQLVLDPPARPGDRAAEPYWVVSTRHPDEFIAAVLAARAG
ncbi:MAG TPA: DUF3093 domain-containing protein [Jatrophihabitans sp.]|nr:DUF3093 domain-containing protein [Jatrophihabitans sp.]